MRDSILLETPRLLIREILPGDLEGMFAIDADPEVHRFLGNRYFKDIAESRAYIDLIRSQYEQFGIGRWAMLLKDSGDFVGWTGFKFMTDKVNGHVHHHDFGYRLARRYWGRGLATEGSRAALDYGIDVLGLKEIYAMTDVNNGASRNILERLGFHLIEIFAYDAPPTWRAFYGEPATWYELMDERIGKPAVHQPVSG